jgi:acetyl esterase/lipase
LPITAERLSRHARRARPIRFHPRRPWTPFAVALSLLAVLTLEACGSTVEPSPSPNSTPTPPRATPSASASPTETEAPSPPTVEPPPPFFTPGPPGSFEPPCGEADPTCTSLNVQLKQNIDFTGPVPCGSAGVSCLLRVDAFSPPAASDLPIVVMIPGGPLPPGNRETMWALARYVAGRGAVVFTADYRSSPAYGGGYPSTFADVGCAIRFARQQGAELGGDPGRVTLVAHSFGGFPASVVDLSAHDFAADELACLASKGNGQPDAFVGIAGVYTLDRIGQDFLADFFGGDRSTAPDAWAAADAAKLVRSGRRSPAPVRLLVGTDDLIAPDTTAEELAAILRDADYDVGVTTVPNATHESILRSVTTVDAVASLANQAP